MDGEIVTLCIISSYNISMTNQSPMESHIGLKMACEDIGH